MTTKLEALEEALRLVRSIIVDAAATGFNCNDGDWAERLYASQHDTHAALALPRDDWRPPADELPWTAEKSGRGSWIKNAKGEWTALTCGNTDESADRHAAMIIRAINGPEPTR